MNAFTDFDGLIHHDFQTQVDHLGVIRTVRTLSFFFQPRRDLFQFFVNAVDNFNRVGTRLTVHGHVDQRPTVDPHDVGLNLIRVFDFAHILEQYRLATGSNLDRRIIQLGDFVRNRVRVDIEFTITDLGAAGRNQNVLPPQCLMHFHDRQVVGHQLVRIHVGQNTTQRSTIHGRRDHTGNGLQIVPQVLIGNVVKFCVRHIRIGNRNQAQRHAGRGIEGHHHRRNRARRQVEHVAHRVHTDLA